ncbi:MAG: hypothetical protein EOO61_00755 [Hymenobacter sp.]|nr:MAG: hypothetical protein EOO61_00755 [Hymenobacter sp.]
MTEKVIKRGYVKWEDENGFHKEPLSDHPELLAKASPREQLYAEEVKRQNTQAEQLVAENEDDAEQDTKDTLEALKAAPEEIVSATQLTAEEPAAAPEEPAIVETPVEDSDDREAALRELREKTAE